jgi:predicted phage-related endonuclease
VSRALGRFSMAAYEWIVERRNHIIDSAGVTVTALAAWRVAAKQWLLKNGLLTISINKEVSPYFRPAWSH